MKTRIAIAVAATALMAGATAIAPSLASANPNSTAAAITLTNAQRETLWKDLNGHAVTVTPLPHFAAKAGAKVPSAVPLMGMPSKAAQAVPTLKSDDYTTANGKLLIVNPTSRKIADVIAG